MNEFREKYLLVYRKEEELSLKPSYRKTLPNHSREKRYSESPDRRNYLLNYFKYEDFKKFKVCLFFWIAYIWIVKLEFKNTSRIRFFCSIARGICPNSCSQIYRFLKSTQGVSLFSEFLNKKVI